MNRWLGWLVRRLGGPARARVVALLAAALSLQGADVATLSATADNLQRVFGIGNSEIGMLVSVTYFVGALATLPIGVLTDRVTRVRLLALSMGLWAVATALSGAATSFLALLACRAALGAVTATTGPTIASLTGDFFPAATRARTLGLILGGELLGTGIGFVISGEIAALAGWRFAYWWLVIPSVVGAWLTWRLPEPARGGQSRLRLGQDHIPDARETVGADPDTGDGEYSEGPDTRVGDIRDAVVSERGVPDDLEPVPEPAPNPRSLWRTVRYVLRIRTNVVIIVASALGYFFFAGLRSFVIIYVTGHYDIAKSTASVLTLVVGIGALVGVVAGGRAVDWLLGRGRITARVVTPAVTLLATGVVLAPAIVTTSLAVALPLLVLAAGLLSATNPPLDAARLDIIPAALWGRAEAVRTVLRGCGEGAAPVLFGVVSESLFGGHVRGLEPTFLLFLLSLGLAGLLALAAVRTYPHDVATAAAVDHRF